MAENNKTRFFYVLYSDKTRVFDQSERAYYPIYIINLYTYMMLIRESHVLQLRFETKCECEILAVFLTLFI